MAATAVLLFTACTKDVHEAAVAGTGPLGSPKATYHFILPDNSLRTIGEAATMKFEVIDGRCNALGTLYSDHNGSSFPPISYSASVPNTSFTVTDALGNTVTLPLGNHFWIVSASDVGGQYPVLEFDPGMEFDPFAMPCQVATPHWRLHQTNGWSGEDSNGSTLPWLQWNNCSNLPLWDAQNLPDFSPC